MSNSVINARKKVCQSCSFNHEDRCTRIQKITRGKGELMHPLGIPRLRTTCPELKWYGITAFHAWYMKTYVIKNLDQKEAKIYRRIRHNGVNFSTTTHLLSLFRNYGKADFLRKQINLLKKQPDSYQHLASIDDPYLSDADCIFDYPRLT